MKRVLVFLTLFFCASTGFAKELLIERAPNYKRGDRLEVVFPTPLGEVSVTTTVTGLCRFRGDIASYQCVDVQVQIPGSFFETKLAFVPNWSKAVMYVDGSMYRIETKENMFPLYQDDVRTFTALSFQPCRNPKYAGMQCMEVDGIDTCSGFRRVSKGIQFFCEGTYGGSRVVMDPEFRFPVEFELLN